MTNFEKLKELTVNEFWEKITELTSNPLHEYIDYPAYLSDEDSSLIHFVRHKSWCKVRPCEAELLNCCHSGTEAERGLYIAENIKRMMILKDNLRCFGKPYVTVCNPKRMAIMTVPKELVMSDE